MDRRKHCHETYLHPLTISASVLKIYSYQRRDSKHPVVYWQDMPDPGTRQEKKYPLLLTSLQSTFAVDVASVHLLLFWSGVRPGILTSCWRYLVAEGLDLPGVLATPA
ncbi:hypothetical protein ElyMa_005342500 [Elysia marginata]|uniref:Uncharacterized protein n=1 Tax=Elysia marginata TaxID=1093978 RepID=A0AAV4E9T9_9GAST|nr:hypothetical protein ElyMa_005342500 [Elysia marginata]